MTEAIRRLLTRRPTVVLGLAVVWGQLKTVVLLALGAWCADLMPAWMLWLIGTGAGQLISYGCYVTTTWAESYLRLPEGGYPG